MSRQVSALNHTNDLILTPTTAHRGSLRPPSFPLAQRQAPSRTALHQNPSPTRTGPARPISTRREGSQRRILASRQHVLQAISAARETTQAPERSGLLRESEEGVVGITESVVVGELCKEDEEHGEVEVRRWFLRCMLLSSNGRYLRAMGDPEAKSKYALPIAASRSCRNICQTRRVRNGANGTARSRLTPLDPAIDDWA